MARFLIDAAFAARTDHPFPLGILAVNLAGAFVLGLVAGAALEGEALAIVAGGGIGSFTTFSTWILDSHRLADAGHARLVWLNSASRRRRLRRRRARPLARRGRSERDSSI